MSRPASGPVAKISSPTLGRVLRRPRLFRLLDRARKHPMLGVTGPPGSGKTTLVASYLAARRLRSLWYQADEGDAGLAAFSYYMGLAAQRVTRRKGKPPPLLTPEDLVEEFCRRLMTRALRLGRRADSLATYRRCTSRARRGAGGGAVERHRGPLPLHRRLALTRGRAAPVRSRIASAAGRIRVQSVTRRPPSSRKGRLTPPRGRRP